MLPHHSNPAQRKLLNNYSWKNHNCPLTSDSPKHHCNYAMKTTHTTVQNYLDRNTVRINVPTANALNFLLKTTHENRNVDQPTYCTAPTHSKPVPPQNNFPNNYDSKTTHKTDNKTDQRPRKSVWTLPLQNYPQNWQQDGSTSSKKCPNTTTPKLPTKLTTKRINVLNTVPKNYH